MITQNLVAFSNSISTTIKPEFVESGRIIQKSKRRIMPDNVVPGKNKQELFKKNNTTTQQQKQKTTSIEETSSSSETRTTTTTEEMGSHCYKDQLLPAGIDFGSSVHAAFLSYSCIANAGPPALPLELPTPSVTRGTRTSVAAYDHRTGKVHIVKNVLMRATTLHNKNKQLDRAYLVRKQCARSIYGDIYLCVVLRRRVSYKEGATVVVESGGEIYNIDTLKDSKVEWESTEELVAVKASSWAKIHHLRGRHLEDPIKEVAAMQLIGNYHPNVIGIIDALQDDNFLYTVVPYCTNGDLYGRIFGGSKGRRSRSSDRSISGEHTISTDISDSGTRVDETLAREVFRQLLSGLYHLQKKGVCHRDLSLENLLIDEKGLLKIIDLGMCLRVPHEDPNNYGCVTDVSAGTPRRLMKAQGQGGKLIYMAPEVINRDDAFDGFAIDLWASGVILFVILVGVAPFKWAHESDKRYAKIAKGNLKQSVKDLGDGIQLSNEVCDLLQNMLWRDPHKRLTLAQVMQHPWVLNKKFHSSRRQHQHHQANNTKKSSSSSSLSSQGQHHNNTVKPKKEKKVKSKRVFPL